MSGVRGVGMPAYTHINFKACPVCGKPTKNFEMHTRNREDHKAFRQAQEQHFRRLMAEHAQKYQEFLPFDSGQVTALNQKAWNEAIKEFGGSTEKVEVKEKLPKHAITEGTICPKTGKNADQLSCGKCIDQAAVGSNIKYFVCMELKHKKP